VTFSRRLLGAIKIGMRDRKHPKKFVSFASTMALAASRDHVGALEDAFHDVVQSMLGAIESIQRDAAAPTSHPPDPNQVRFDQLPRLAEEVVGKFKTIDRLIDEAERDTCIGQDVEEIKRTLEQQQAEYDRDVMELAPLCTDAEMWIDRIREMINLIAANSLWKNPA
jgi:hypothetical protein